jgi:uncharacterized delta-60 repeat protein
MLRLTQKPLVERLEDRLLLDACDLDVVFAGGRATANFSLGPAQLQVLAVQADGRIVAAGQAGSSNSEFTLARFNRNGTLDASFGSGGEVITSLAAGQNSAARGIAIQPDGKIVVAGFAGVGGSQEFAVARYTSGGTLDATFGSGGIVLTNAGGNASATSDLIQSVYEQYLHRPADPPAWPTGSPTSSKPPLTRH